MNMSLYLGILIIGETLLLFLVLLAANLKDAALIRYILGGVLLIGAFVVFTKASRLYRFRKSLFVVSWAALFFVILYNLVGFLLYPGLVKDLDLFSSEHLIRSGFLFTIVFGVYVITLCGAYGISWVYRRLIS